MAPSATKPAPVAPSKDRSGDPSLAFVRKRGDPAARLGRQVRGAQGPQAPPRYCQPNFAGLVLATDEGKVIAKYLGPHKAALLGNYGLRTAGPAIEATIAWFVLMEKLCKAACRWCVVAGTGKPLVKIGSDECVSSWKAIGHGDAGYFMGLPLFQIAEREFGERTYLGRGMHPI